MTRTDDAIAAHMAATLKGLRRERGWSLTRTAEATGVSKAMLGQIERGESSPTIATLWKLASGFRVAFSTLFDSSCHASRQASLGRQSEGAAPTWGEAWGEDSAGMQARLLFPFDPLLGFEMLLVELAPGAISESAPHASGVVEHIVVVEGELALRLDEHWTTLAAGEGIRFFADRPHAMRNPGKTRLRFHDVIHYLPGAASSA
ncbi:helix-turn-helix domain-containing protein [Halomonas dongshanensis]|uniref:XRE family transcriptional regulator n=1 Tax=Halomonas dongshanensis TaxID=2890835 RepID=A0ABT2EHB1_9GAMM|nr:XRE family transcriptional regulator [Halomonas dongshanensis]MCS2610728.1 XRE family transcriptional regulator [Halomonas dongshanensis]